MRMISRKELAKLVGISTRTLDREHLLPKDFPKKIRITNRRVGYNADDVKRYLTGSVTV